MLILKNISKQYEGSKNLTLKNINLEFPATGLISILGPSGCGKTTLLNLIGGLDKPSGGEIIVDGISLNTLSKKDLNKYHNQCVSFIYQSYNLINYLNVEKNIELISKSPYTNELIDYLHLSTKKKSKIKNLSGGEKQRVAIARSLINSPHILLCDEPTGALDKKTSHEIMELLKNISKSTLVIMVTHNEFLAKKYSNRIITLEDGKVIKDTNQDKVEKCPPYKLKKVKVSISRIINIIMNNIKSKYKRNIISTIAFSVGLISLSLVLGISNGFNKSLEIEEKESLSMYPIIISESSRNLDNDLKEIFKQPNSIENNFILKQDENHKNIITTSYINDLAFINDNLNYRIDSYYIDNILLNTSKKRLKEMNIIAGSDIENKNDLILIVNNNIIGASNLDAIGLLKEKYSYEEILNYEFMIKKDKYRIVGIAEFEEDSYLSTITGFLSYQEITQNIPYMISLYPKDYQSKMNLINHLNKYENVEYTDYSATIKNISQTLMDGITIILVSFSTISLIVSALMIGIISYISIIERIKEIGLFKSLGLSDAYVKIIFMGENLTLGIFASIFSFSIAKILSIPINELLTNLTGMKNIMLINIDLLTLLLIISSFISVIGSYFPIRKTKKLKIVDALKYE